FCAAAVVVRFGATLTRLRQDRHLRRAFGPPRLLVSVRLPSWSVSEPLSPGCARTDISGEPSARLDVWVSARLPSWSVSEPLSPGCARTDISGEPSARLDVGGLG
ncbi:hypothetical protein, partial [Nakamurella sp. UYEF19]|uniref:hypothetical protein n=1 Tax=Nakamurella sp. UYEF19 TaxID=1756392 RepID=UPI0033948B36